MFSIRSELPNSVLRWIGCVALVYLFAAPVFSTNVVMAQSGINQSSGGNCSPNIIGGGNVIVNCPGSRADTNSPRPQALPGGPGGRMRRGEFIPTCPFGYGYSREHRQCIPSQYIGGIIPCSQDDTECR